MSKLSLFIALCICALSLPCYAKKLDDAHYMQIALEIAKHNPQAPFGAILVDNETGEIVAEGLNASKANPTFHGEMVAINECAKKHPNINWSNLTLYTTAEPCSMCQSAIVWANISRVVYATSMEYLIAHGWDQINIKAAEINRHAPFYKGKVTGGVLADKTDALFTK